MQHVPTHVAVGVSQAAKAGKPGQGIAVLVSRKILSHVKLWRVSTAMQMVWLLCDGSLFGTDQEVLIGACYVPPVTAKRHHEEVSNIMLTLSQEVSEAQQRTPNVIVMGDLNAHLGMLPECGEGHALAAEFPELLCNRLCKSAHVNSAGRDLLQVLSGSHLIATTGRGHGDEGQLTCKGSSRTEHILLSAALYRLPRSVAFGAMLHEFDHLPLTIKLQVPSSCATAAHVCGPGCALTQRLMWRDTEQGKYGAGLLLQESALADLRRSVSLWDGHDQGSVDSLQNALQNLITKAADHAGMLGQQRCSLSAPHCTPNDKPAWYDSSCRRAKAQLWRSLHARITVVDYRLQKKKYKALLARKKARWTKHRAAKFTDQLRHSSSEAFVSLRKKLRRPQSGVGQATWQQFLKSHFIADQGPAPSQILQQNAPALPYTVPDFAAFSVIVQKQLSRMSMDTAPGFDHLSVPFIKRACVKDGEVNMLLGFLSQWFYKMLTTGVIPSAWKVARISPLYKGEGDVTDPSKYRMLAVSSVLYRLYANVLRVLLTSWCTQHGVMPDEQFGFIPGRCTQQPMFILHHVVHAQRHCGQAKHKKVHTAFIDFKQAYDHIPRHALWDHLAESVRMPPLLLSAIKGLYDHDSYVLVDGTNRCDPVHANKGVKQGCPLSPLLFALYVNDIATCFRQATDGVIKVGSQPVTHVMYADDLTLMASTHTGLQHLVSCLAPYALRKHLTVNVQKSKVMVFNSRSPPCQPPITYNEQEMPEVSSFRFLGLQLGKSMHMGQAVAGMRCGMFAAMREVNRIASSQGVQGCPYAMCHLLRAFVVPHGMYASQIWGPEFLGPQNLFKSPIQARMTSFLRYILRVRRTVSANIVLHELCQLPLQYYWLRSVCRFWNAMPAARSALLTRVASADALLGSGGKSCWSKSVNVALEGVLHGDFSLAQDLSSINVRQMCDAWLNSWHNRWAQWAGDPTDPSSVHRSLCAYLTWFKQGDGCKLRDAHSYLGDVRLPDKVRFSMAALRTGNHGFEVERGRLAGMHFEARICRRCQAEVDDEPHALFRCPSTQAARDSHPGVALCQNNIPALMQASFAPHFVHAALTCVVTVAHDLEGREQANRP